MGALLVGARASSQKARIAHAQDTIEDPEPEATSKTTNTAEKSDTRVTLEITGVFWLKSAIMPKGGKRYPPGGRQKGVPQKHTLARRDALAHQGPSPLKAMLYKMTWWLQRVATLQAVAAEQQDRKEIERALDKVEEAARGAAPYFHPRLAAVAVKAEISNRIDLTKCTAKELDFLERIIGTKLVDPESADEGGYPGGTPPTEH